MALYGGIALHSNNHVVVVIDEEDRWIFERRLGNDLALAFNPLTPVSHDWRQIRWQCLVLPEKWRSDLWYGRTFNNVELPAKSNNGGFEMLQFRELYCISDLHLGGRAPNQIFDQGDLLAAMISQIGSSETSDIALVLNGDLVDFLAEPQPPYLNPAGAVTQLERIFGDSAFSSVSKALARFVAKPGRQLIIVLGNHDVELALPAIQQRLISELAGDNAAARGRIRFATEGAGFGCKVGGARILIVHGNEFDSWNVVDHLQLLQVSRAINRGAPIPSWTPNAGTQLVIDVMNDVKYRWPVVSNSHFVVQQLK